MYFCREDGDSTWENLHYFKGLHGSFPAANVARTVPALTGACLLMHREVWDQVGGFKGVYVQGDFEDSDLCLRIADLGYACWYLPGVQLYHLEGQSYPGSLRRLTSHFNAWLHTHLWDDRIAEVMSRFGDYPNHPPAAQQGPIMRLATIQGPLEIGLDYRRYVPAAKTDQAASPALNHASPHNIGDWFVTKATDRLLAYDELFIINRRSPDKDWDAINSECSALVLKGGNYIQTDWLSQTFGLEMFKKIKIPIVIFGAGIQAPAGQNVHFAPEEAEILRYIHASSACSSVRGHSTAEALSSIGIDNVAVTACPTAFWSRLPEIVVRAPDDHSCGFSFRQSLYSDDPHVLASQFGAIETVRDKFGKVTVILQGEEVVIQRYLQALRWGAEHEAVFSPVESTGLRRLERRPLDIEQLGADVHTRFGRYTRPALLDWFMNNSFFSYDIGEYLSTYRSQGMVVGCRLHSNLVSVANRTPTVFLTYDQRTTELAQLLQLPNCPLAEFGPGFDLMGQDWRPFEKAYAVRYAEMRRFLDSNGLAHNLRG